MHAARSGMLIIVLVSAVTVVASCHRVPTAAISALEELRAVVEMDEAGVPRNLEPGDQVTMHYLMGMVTEITK